MAKCSKDFLLKTSEELRKNVAHNIGKFPAIVPEKKIDRLAKKTTLQFPVKVLWN